MEIMYSVKIVGRQRSKREVRRTYGQADRKLKGGLWKEEMDGKVKS